MTLDVEKKFTPVDVEKGIWSCETRVNGILRELEENKVELITKGRNGKKLKLPREHRVNKVTVWGANGVKQTETETINDIGETTRRYFREDGTLELEHVRNQNEIHGLIRSFDKNGKKISQKYLPDDFVLPLEIAEPPMHDNENVHADLRQKLSRGPLLTLGNNLN